MIAAALVLLVSAPSVQDPPLVRGAYRGPYDEVLVEQALIESGAAGFLDDWDRWEFWFEHERAVLFRGLPESKPSAVLENGALGNRPWSLRWDYAREHALPTLTEALQSSYPEIREAAALSLGRIGDRASVAVLERTLRDKDARVRHAALLGLGLLGAGRPLVVIAEEFTDLGRPESHRAFAGVALGLSGRPEGAEILSLYLQRSLRPDRIAGLEQFVVQGAVWGAGLADYPALTPVLLTGLERLERVHTASSIRIRTLLIQALGRSSNVVDVLPALRRQLRNNDPALQRAGAQALAALGDADALPALAKRVLETSDSETVLLSLLAIGRIGGVQAEEQLRELENFARRHRQHYSAWCLAAGLAGSPELTAAIEKEFLTRPSSAGGPAESQRRDEERLRGAMALGMGFHGDPNVVGALVTVFEEPGTDPDFAGYVAVALGQVGTKEAVEVLVRAAASGRTEADFRRGLALGLGLTGDRRAATSLAALLIGDRNPSVRWSAVHALGLIRSRAAFDQLLRELRQPGELRRTAAQTAHLVLALGYLGDRRSGAGLGACVAGMNYRQEFPLFRALASY